MKRKDYEAYKAETLKLFAAQLSEVLHWEIVRQLMTFGEDCMEILRRLGNDRWTQIDARVWHRILTKRFRRLTAGLNFPQKPNMKKKGRSK